MKATSATQCTFFGYVVTGYAASVGACFVFVIAMSLSATSSADEFVLNYGKPVQLAKLKHNKIKESSGIAASQLDANLFWTHNDSGDKARLYCFDRNGSHKGTCKVKRAGAIDWEDMCSFKFNGMAKLLIGDIGDNGARRKSCRLYLMNEPKNPSDDVKKLQVLKLRYSTGPMDCEAIGIDVPGKKLLFVEKKRWITCRVFEADINLDGATGDFIGQKDDMGIVELVAKPIGQVKLPLVTAMDVSSDGKRAIVMTLGQSFEYRRGDGETWKDAFAGKPRTIDMPPRKQGEAICYGNDGRDLFLTSELSPTPFFMVPVVSAQ